MWKIILIFIHNYKFHGKNVDNFWWINAAQNTNICADTASYPHFYAF